jgi:hypothetical protein
MKRFIQFAITVQLIGALMQTESLAQYAAEVISYNQGAIPSPGGFTNPSAALGEPERLTGESGPFPFPNVVSPFSPPYLTNEVVSIGQGGQITLRLSHFAIPQLTGPPEIGVFANLGINDVDYPNGQAGAIAGTLSLKDKATVEVSADGVTWQGVGTRLFDVPTNAYLDVSPSSSVPGNVPSDFQKPFVGSLSDFNGRSYASMLTLLDGSGGGNWIDISSSGLAQVGYIRFSRDNSVEANVSLNFDLDAVVISQAALGAEVVPEPATLAGAIIAIGIAIGGRRPRRTLARD